MNIAAKTDNINLSDSEFIEGLLRKDPRIEKAFYHNCRRYFYEHFSVVFFASEDIIDDIFENTFIALWLNIERGKIFVKDGIVMGRGGKPLQCSLTTYLMSIGRNKYKELSRDKAKIHLTTSYDSKNALQLVDDWQEEDYEKAMMEAISDSISLMPGRCNDILTKFYYENKNLDVIMTEIPEYSTKDSLKSNKNRCLNKLKAFARSLYEMRKKL